MPLLELGWLRVFGRDGDDTATLDADMTLHLINGLEGTGKSTLCHILRSRGYPALDADAVPDLCQWLNLTTGEMTPVDRVPFPVSQEWWCAHRWIWKPSKIEELVSFYEDRQGFLCGSASNEQDFFKSFGLRFYQWARDSTVIERLQQRDPYFWRHGSEDLTRRLRDNKSGKTDAILNGSIALYCDLPAEDVANDLLAYVASAKSSGGSIRHLL